MLAIKPSCPRAVGGHPVIEQQMAVVRLGASLGSRLRGKDEDLHAHFTPLSFTIFLYTAAMLWLDDSIRSHVPAGREFEFVLGLEGEVFRARRIAA